MAPCRPNGALPRSEARLPFQRGSLRFELPAGAVDWPWKNLQSKENNEDESTVGVSKSPTDSDMSEVDAPLSLPGTPVANLSSFATSLKASPSSHNLVWFQKSPSSSSKGFIPTALRRSGCAQTSLLKPRLPLLSQQSLHASPVDVSGEDDASTKSPCSPCSDLDNRSDLTAVFHGFSPKSLSESGCSKSGEWSSRDVSRRDEDGEVASPGCQSASPLAEGDDLDVAPGLRTDDGCYRSLSSNGVVGDFAVSSCDAASSGCLAGARTGDADITEALHDVISSFTSSEHECHHFSCAVSTPLIDAVQGLWKTLRDTEVRIRGEHATWVRDVGGDLEEVDGRLLMCFSDGSCYYATLDDAGGTLTWDDGDVWRWISALESESGPSLAAPNLSQNFSRLLQGEDCSLKCRRGDRDTVSAAGASSPLSRSAAVHSSGDVLLVLGESFSKISGDLLDACKSPCAGGG